MTELNFSPPASLTLNVEETQLEIKPEYQRIEFVSPGPQGAQGPQGPAGAAGGSIVEFSTSGTPMNPWVIVHNFARLVHVTTLGDDGEQHFGEVHQVPPYNSVTIYFGNPFSGKALVG